MLTRCKFLWIVFILTFLNQSSGGDVFFVPYGGLKKTIYEAEVRVEAKLKLLDRHYVVGNGGSRIALAPSFTSDKYLVIHDGSAEELNRSDYGFPPHSGMIFDRSLKVVGYVSSDKETCMINGAGYRIQDSGAEFGRFIDQPNRVKLKPGTYMSNGFICIQVTVVDHMMRKKYGYEKLTEMGEIFFKIFDVKNPEQSIIERKGKCHWIHATKDSLKIVYSVNVNAHAASTLKYEEIRISGGEGKVVKECDIPVRDSESNLRIADIDEEDGLLLFHRVPRVSEKLFGRPYAEVFDLVNRSYLEKMKFPFWGATSIVFFSSEDAVIETAEPL